MTHRTNASAPIGARDLRRACRALTPVVVDLGPGQAKLEATLRHVDGSGDEARLVLSPIAADAIPPQIFGAVTIRSRDPELPLLVAARSIVRAGHDTASVRLAGARFEWMPKRTGRTDGRGRAPIVLLIPRTANDTAPHVFPIVELGRSFCSIQATVPLVPGSVIDQVEIIGDRRRLRRATACVIETIPWRTARGDRRFRCRLSLDDVEQTGTVGRAYEVVSDAAQVRRSIQLAAMLARSGWITDPTGASGRARIESADRDVLRLVIEDDFTPRSGGLIRLGFELFDVSYEVDVRVIARADRDLEATWPVVMRRRRRRQERRIPVPEPLALELSYLNPASAERDRCSVRDVSLRGVCFDASPDAPIWPGLVLEEAVLVGAHARVELGDVEVRGTSDGGSVLRCHAAFLDAGKCNDRDLADLLAQLAHPEAEPHDGSDFRGVLDVWQRGGLFAPHMTRNFEPLAPRVASVWRRLHQDGSDVVRTLVHRSDGEIDGTASVLRAWERTWIGQHFAAISTRAGQVSGTLHFAAVDHVLLRPDGHYLMFFVKGDNERMNAFYQRFFELTGTPEAFERSVVELWSRSRAELDAPEGDDARRFLVRALRSSDELLVERAAESLFGSLATSALSFRPGDVTLPSTSRAFSKAQLIRGRRCRVVTRRGTPVWALLEERASPGLNLTWMLNATWVLPLHPELDPTHAGLRKGLADLVAGPEPETAGDRFLLTPAGLAQGTLAEHGFQMEADASMFVMNRAGLYRYHQYVADRYGEVAALVARRERGRERRARHVAMAEAG